MESHPSLDIGKKWDAYNILYDGSDSVYTKR